MVSFNGLTEAAHSVAQGEAGGPYRWPEVMGTAGEPGSCSSAAVGLPPSREPWGRCRAKLLIHVGLSGCNTPARTLTTSRMEFAWDPKKADSNQKKHKVTFSEATEVFADFHSSTISDPDHSDDANRFLIFGLTARGRYLAVSFTEGSGKLRLISARPMTPRERRAYE